MFNKKMAILSLALVLISGSAFSMQREEGRELPAAKMAISRAATALALPAGALSLNQQMIAIDNAKLFVREAQQLIFASDTNPVTKNQILGFLDRALEQIDQWSLQATRSGMKNSAYRETEAAVNNARNLLNSL